MLIAITTLSILAISVLVWLANKIMPFTVCPMCAGVFLTWVGLLGARSLGYEVAPEVPALLMGGSVIGIVYQLEKKFQNSLVGIPPLWKTFFALIGFVMMYAILEQLWTVFFFTTVFLFLLLLLFWYANRTSRPREEVVTDIEKEIKDCC